eukprot:7786861-Ditylum_brightwellii.AAC.1
MHCIGNPEPWTVISLQLTIVFWKNEVDPIMWILFVKFLPTKSTLQTLTNDHPTKIFKPYKVLIDAQTNIRWKQLYIGWWSIHWDCYQQCFNNHSKIESNREPVWIGQIIRSMWTHAHLRQKVWNSYQHNNKYLRYNATKEALLYSIYAVYAHQHKLLEQDQFPFAIPLKQWSQKPASNMKLWLR